MDEKTPLVSVICLTYNHEKYIRRCLEGLLKQKTGFDYEVIVHDDASTDATPDLVREYAEKAPDIIKPILQKENRFSRGLSIIEPVILPVLRGKYVAMCEGDDYWTDPLKLEKQVRALADHPDCRLCLHLVDNVTEQGEPMNATSFSHFHLDFRKAPKSFMAPRRSVLAAMGRYSTVPMPPC